jgi:hypothetical protein
VALLFPLQGDVPKCRFVAEGERPSHLIGIYNEHYFSKGQFGPQNVEEKF